MAANPTTETSVAGAFAMLVLFSVLEYLLPSLTVVDIMRAYSHICVLCCECR